MSSLTGQETARLNIRTDGTKYLMIPVWILIAAILMLGVVQSGNPANLLDSSAFLFVLAGGMALVMISFPGAEIMRMLRNAAGTPMDDVDIRSSALFWEAAGRGFWILGAMRSILHLMMFFHSMAAVEYGTLQLVIQELSQCLLPTLYGILLALICFIPRWRLMGKTQSRPPAPTDDKRASIGRPGSTFGVGVGYILFFSFLIPCFTKLPRPDLLLMILKPAVLVILGGTMALMLSVRRAGSGQRCLPFLQPWGLPVH